MVKRTVVMLGTLLCMLLTVSSPALAVLQKGGSAAALAGDAPPPREYQDFPVRVTEDGHVSAGYDVFVECRAVSADVSDEYVRAEFECDRRRAKNQEMFRADAMTLDELRAANAALDEERRAAEEGLRAAARAGERVAEMEEAKRAALEMFGTGLMGGIVWFPPSLRRGVYALLGLKVTVFADRTFRVEGTFDADLMRLTPEVREYVAALREVEERLGEAPAEGTQERIDRIEQELAALRRSLVCRGAPASG